jgi:hypothetical protein
MVSTFLPDVSEPFTETFRADAHRPAVPKPTTIRAIRRRVSRKLVLGQRRVRELKARSTALVVQRQFTGYRGLAWTSRARFADRPQIACRCCVGINICPKPLQTNIR